MDRAKAAKAVREFAEYVEEAAFAGGGHPDLMDWRKQCLEIARERLIRKMIGDNRRLRMPPQPEVEYD